MYACLCQSKRYAELRAHYRRLIVYGCLFFFAALSALHLALLYRPELLRARLTERLIKEMWTYSPIFKLLEIPYLPPGAASAAAGAVSGRFDEL